ncbi:MAG TPA: poly-gamma-glutamate system protein [Phycisphaerae bacterium]|nr:poly-gamma-glutamate system protein [Phycisphaerae bacterium]HUU21369.1 poly-gamma-glutamate system protein [Phycisphaerae bacterium]
MIWRPTKVSRRALAALAAASLAALAAADGLRPRRPQPFLKEKLAAAEKMHEAISAVSRHRAGAGYEFDLSIDPRRTGMIGPEFTPITNDRGSLRAKQIVLNPNFAALAVQMFKQAGVRRGDTVTVAWTGSLPGANLAVLSAAEVLGIRLIPIHSISASMYGANDPQFAWLDMEKLLHEEGVFDTRSVMATYGGDEDRGKGLGRDARGLIQDIAARTDVPLVREDDLTGQIRRREQEYARLAGGAPIRAYVNIGGGIGSIGARINGLIMTPGVNRSTRGKDFGRAGVMTRMAQRGVPVIHINYIDRLCRRYGYASDPAADPTPGAGPMFLRRTHNLFLVAALLAGLLAVFFITIRIDTPRYLHRRPATIHAGV